MSRFPAPLNPVGGRVDILYVTYKKDFDWLDYSLASVMKFTTGFGGVTVAVPHSDVIELRQRVAGVDVNIVGFNDIPNKGFLVHAMKIGYGDQLCPKADFIAHMDADCIVKEPTVPGHFFDATGKPYLIYKPYESLIDNDTGKVSDCYQWRIWAEHALGAQLPVYTMTRHPSVYPRDLYRGFRKHVASLHQCAFDYYVLRQKNSFPQTYAEFPSMGGYGWLFMRDAFCWLDCASEPVPDDKLRVYWSHGGLKQRVGPGWRDGRAVASNAVDAMTAEQEIQSILARQW